MPAPVDVAIQALKTPLPFRLVQISEPRMRGVDDFLRHWCAECGLGDERAREVVRVYIEYCSPSEASDESLYLDAEFLMWFFALNDISDGPAKRETLNEALSILAGTEIGMSPLAAATRRFRDRIATIGPDTRRLSSSIDAMFAAFFWEIDHVGQIPTTPEYEGNREHFVAVYPYIIIFRLGFGLSSDNAGWPELEAIERLSVQIVYLVNDILSVARDDRKSKQNIVFSLASDYNLSRSDAVSLAVDRLFARIDEFRLRRENFLSSVEVDERLRVYLEFLGTYLEGTRVSTLILRDRYFGQG